MPGWREVELFLQVFYGKGASYKLKAIIYSQRRKLLNPYKDLKCLILSIISNFLLHLSMMIIIPCVSIGNKVAMKIVRFLLNLIKSIIAVLRQSSYIFTLVLNLSIRIRSKNLQVARMSAGKLSQRSEVCWSLFKIFDFFGDFHHFF